MATRMTLLFNPRHICLGELTTRDGAFVRCTLSAEGEQWLGYAVQEWQTQGVASAASPHRTQPKEAGFLSAFLSWAIDNDVVAVQVCEEAMPCWEQILQLPFETTERFILISSLSKLPVPEIPKWQTALAGVQRAVQNV